MSRLDDIEAELATLACSDGGCVIRRPSGMHTNGGCHCVEYIHPTHEEQRKLKRALMLRQEQVRLLRSGGAK